MNNFIKVCKKIAIVGHGGFAREIACRFNVSDYNFFINMNSINDDNRFQVNDLESIDISKYDVMVAVGDPVIRKKIIQNLVGTYT